MRTKKGFTLIELIVTLSIMGILASIAVPRLTGYVDKARTTKAITIGKQFQMSSLWSYSEMSNRFDSNNLVETLKTATGIQGISLSSIKSITDKTVSIAYSSESKSYILNINMNDNNYTITEGGVIIFVGN